MTALLRGGGRPLSWVLALALVLRISLACWPAFGHADEAWQYLEGARHVAGKPWIATWEARAGARGWLFPTVLAGPLALGQGLAPGTFLAVLLPRLVCVALSMAAVLAAAGLGFRLSRAHGLAAAFVAAIWYELVFFGSRALSEPVATALILVAAWLLQGRERRSLLVAGLVLGLACAVRFQYAPAAAVLVALTLRRDWPAWSPVLAGGVAGLAASALADAAMGAVPFAWVVRSVSLNLVANRSADYGTSPVYGYAALLWRSWGPAGAALLVLGAIGARRYPALAATAAVNLAIHSLIPHKEARFVLLSTAIVVVLAALGSVDAAARYRPATRPRTIAAAWLLLCAVGAAGMPGWGRLVRLNAAWRSVARVPGLCGVGVYRTPPLVVSRAMLARDVPIYLYDDASAAAARRSRAFDVAVTTFARRDELPGYRPVSCSGDRPGDLCVRAWPGGCAAQPEDAAFDANAVLARLDV